MPDACETELRLGHEMHALMARMFPICRSITGNGLRESLRILQEHIPLEIHEVPSGTRCFDWTVPDEWNIRDAYVVDPDGNKILDFQENNLRIVGYSEPFEGDLSLEELRPHLHTDPNVPEGVPYMTAYYRRHWGFCLSQHEFEALKPGTYRVVVDSTLAPGSMSYGELLIPGSSDREILLSTNLCHPSLANNELSGPVLITFLAKWLMEQHQRRFGYRVLVLPETIGAICYLSRHAEEMKRRIVAGYQVVCVGGPGDFTYLKSRRGNTPADRIAIHVLRHAETKHRVLDYPDRASDERQWCSPGIDLPVGSLMRSKHLEYPEYHTSLDDLDFVNPDHLQASFAMYARCIEALEENRRYRGTVEGCEPNLGKRGLYPALGGRSHEDADAEDLLALLAYSDGDRDLIDIAETHGRAVWSLYDAADTLRRHGLLEDA